MHQASIYCYITTPYKSLYNVAQLAHRKWVGKAHIQILNGVYSDAMIGIQ